MAPIDQDTIHVETWTNGDGKVKKQVVAEGDETTPGTYIFVYGIKPENVNYVRGEGRLVDVNVEELVYPEMMERRPPTPQGVWKKVKEV